MTVVVDPARTVDACQHVPRPRVWHLSISGFSSRRTPAWPYSTHCPRDRVTATGCDPRRERPRRQWAGSSRTSRNATTIEPQRRSRRDGTDERPVEVNDRYDPANLLGPIHTVTPSGYDGSRPANSSSTEPTAVRTASVRRRPRQWAWRARPSTSARVVESIERGSPGVW